VTEVMMLGAAASFLAGSFGYILFVFWLKPLLKYRHIRRQVISTLDAIEAPAADIGADRRKALRQLAARLSACYSEQLPDWYQLLLKRRNELPLEAAAGLMKLAATRDRTHVRRQLESVRRALNLLPPAGS
jgi:hypothetical protein